MLVDLREVRVAIALVEEDMKIVGGFQLPLITLEFVDNVGVVI